MRRIGRRVDVALQPERAQRLDGIGRKPDAGADLGKLRRLLADDDLGVLALKRERRRKPPIPPPPIRMRSDRAICPPRDIVQ